MERDQDNAAAAAGAGAGAGGGSRRWEASPDGVIVLPVGSAAPRHAHGRPQREREQAEREQKKTAVAVAAGVFAFGEQHHHYPPEPPEKVFYKTRLCEKFEAGKCAYEDGCTFAHGEGELRPPLPVPVERNLMRWTPPPPLPPPPPPLPLPLPPPGAESPYGGGGYFGKVCFLYRDRGTCHFGDRCSYAHASAAEVAEKRYPGGPRSVEHALRHAPPLARAAYPPGHRSSTSYAPAAARAFPPAPPAAAVGEDGRKLSRLEILSRKKTKSIYGDWPEED